jgi:membrane protein insertase Oxa1/YidC/SpoIIIJ
METVIPVIEQALNGDVLSIIKIVIFFIILSISAQVLKAVIKHPITKMFLFITAIMIVFLVATSPHTIGEQFNLLAVWIENKLNTGSIH